MTFPSNSYTHHSELSLKRLYPGPFFSIGFRLGLSSSSHKTVYPFLSATFQPYPYTNHHIVHYNHTDD